MTDTNSDQPITPFLSPLPDSEIEFLKDRIRSRHTYSDSDVMEVIGSNEYWRRRARLAEAAIRLQQGDSGVDVWHWDESGENWLESLICPILISADHMRAIQATIADRDAQIKQINIEAERLFNIAVKRASDIERAEAEAARLREWLTAIKTGCGKVCEEFETCDHIACKSSVDAWMMADRALKGESLKALTTAKGEGR